MQRIIRTLVLLGLTGFTLFSPGCGSQMAEAVLDGVTEYVASTTNALLEEAFPIKDAIGA